MNTLFLILEIEAALLALTVLFIFIAEVSQKHPQQFNIPKLTLPTAKFEGFMKTLRQDIDTVWHQTQPEFYTSPDGHTLYLSAKLTANWKPEQVVLFMLAHKQEFLDQLKASDPAVFDAVNSLVGKLSSAEIQVKLDNLHLLPTITKDVVVWKLPLIDLPPAEQAIADTIVKEIGVPVQ